MIRPRQQQHTAIHFLACLAPWTGAKQKPYCTWIHFFDPHQPYRPSRADLLVTPTPYDAEISGVDRQIGRIVHTLRDDGLLDDTLLIVSADHGDSLVEHGEQTHSIFYYYAIVRLP